MATRSIPDARLNELLLAITKCRRFIGTPQMNTMVWACRGEEREWFKAKFLALAHLFDVMPRTCDTDGAGDKAIVHLHYFMGSADWYILERDQEETQEQAFGYADLFGDDSCAELGYISIVEIIREGAELDLHWQPRTLGEVKAERAKRSAA
jgi:hypothetical protein